ncbi:MAG: hypothetical protein DWQ56_11215 [Microcystis aeruginosa DA14]|uniref:Uncharacterized protein n=1 Tax=Microcystis aeruginosa DA14 TaxID=1987506 RepID=A0A3E0ME32_MICAE|nr:MAG: hypothetical protein DWQ56_11215 [Microcystis aeruginosa DA14]
MSAADEPGADSEDLARETVYALDRPKEALLVVAVAWGTLAHMGDVARLVIEAGPAIAEAGVPPVAVVDILAGLGIGDGRAYQQAAHTGRDADGKMVVGATRVLRLGFADEHRAGGKTGGESGNGELAGHGGLLWGCWRTIPPM